MTGANKVLVSSIRIKQVYVYGQVLVSDATIWYKPNTKKTLDYN